MKRWSLFTQVSPSRLVDPVLRPESHRYARMIDGRTLHLHFQLVEPRLCAAYPEATLSAAQTKHVAAVGSYAPILALGTLAEDLPRLRLGHADIAVRGSPRFLELVRDALRVLEESNLDWVVALVAGLISEEAPRDLTPPVLSPASQDDLAAELLAAAACSLARMWASVQPGPAALWAPVDLGQAMTRELKRRRDGTSEPLLETEASHALLERLDTLQPSTLLRELLAMWTSAWNRHLFILASPHDTLPDLDSLEAWQDRP